MIFKRTHPLEICRNTCLVLRNENQTRTIDKALITAKQMKWVFVKLHEVLKNDDSAFLSRHKKTIEFVAKSMVYLIYNLNLNMFSSREQASEQQRLALCNEITSLFLESISLLEHHSLKLRLGYRLACLYIVREHTKLYYLRRHPSKINQNDAEHLFWLALHKMELRLGLFQNTAKYLDYQIAVLELLSKNSQRFPEWLKLDWVDSLLIEMYNKIIENPIRLEKQATAFANLLIPHLGTPSWMTRQEILQDARLRARRFEANGIRILHDIRMSANTNSHRNKRSFTLFAKESSMAITNQQNKFVCRKS